MIALANVAVMVSNAKVTARWWTKNLGFATYTIGGSGHATLVAPPGDRCSASVRRVRPARAGGHRDRLHHRQMDALVARMSKGKVQFPVPPKKQSWGSMAKFADPDGKSSGSSKLRPPWSARP